MRNDFSMLALPYARMAADTVHAVTKDAVSAQRNFMQGLVATQNGKIFLRAFLSSPEGGAVVRNLDDAVDAHQSKVVKGPALAISARPSARRVTRGRQLGLNR